MTNLFNLNALLAAAIEKGIVSTLNALRSLWDGDEQYAMYSFLRQPQTFSDVRLQDSADPSDVLPGIEPKGWYLLATEEEPSFRFPAPPASLRLGLRVRGLSGPAPFSRTVSFWC